MNKIFDAVRDYMPEKFFHPCMSCGKKILIKPKSFSGKVSTCSKHGPDMASDFDAVPDI